MRAKPGTANTDRLARKQVGMVTNDDNDNDNEYNMTPPSLTSFTIQ